jgi:hypothetical protein
MPGRQVLEETGVIERSSVLKYSDHSAVGRQLLLILSGNAPAGRPQRYIVRTTVSCPVRLADGEFRVASAIGLRQDFIAELDRLEEVAFPDIAEAIFLSVSIGVPDQAKDV